MKPQTIRVSYDSPEDEALFRWAATNVDSEAKRRNDLVGGRNQDSPWIGALDGLRAFLSATRDWWKL